jgi:nicotinamide mononucleotide transporter
MASGFVAAIAETISKTDAITWIATITAVFYVFLALKESVWCWSFGIVSSGLSVGVYFSELLWYEALLNVFYVALGIYGWIMWSKTKDENTTVSVRKIPSQVLLGASGIAVVAGIIMGIISAKYTENRFAYSDALLTSFSVIATWMTARKYIENWIFWIIIDACCAVLYYFKGPSMYLFTLLFVFYTMMAVGGYYSWKKNLKA